MDIFLRGYFNYNSLHCYSNDGMLMYVLNLHVNLKKTDIAMTLKFSLFDDERHYGDNRETINKDCKLNNTLY